jgi:hypothetical protein
LHYSHREASKFFFYPLAQANSNALGRCCNPPGRENRLKLAGRNILVL